MIGWPSGELEITEKSQTPENGLNRLYPYEYDKK